MALKYGFFNSVNGDRLYNADDLNNFFDGITSDGVFKLYKDELQVVSYSGMTVRVKSGKAICSGKFIENSTTMNITLDGADSQSRIDAIVVCSDLDNRICDIYAKKGVPANSPVPPSMLDTSSKKELALAYITVNANASSISTSNITDKRSDTSVCGWVKLTNVSTEFSTNKSFYTTEFAENIININIPSFDASTDALLVFKNGMLLNEGNEYTIQGTGSAAKIILTNTAPSNNDFAFIVIHAGLS